MFKVRNWIAVFLAAPLCAQSADPLSAVRDYARTYVQNLPNFTAIQSIKRTAKYSPAPQLAPQSQTDRMEERIGYANGRESHKVLRYNGRVMGEESPVRTEGVFSTGEFGGLLATLSREDTGAIFTPARPQKINSRPADVFDFRIPAEPSGYGIKEGTRVTLVAFQGRVFADAATHAVLRIQFQCVDFPAVLRYKSLEMTLDFAPAKIGGREYILPARYTLKTRREDGESSIEATYRNYQRFTADSAILFDEP